jgi:MFS family permease
MDDKSLKSRIRSGRVKFAAMAGAYALGSFNDNFFKQSAMLLAVAANKSWVQGYATVAFSFPYILFAAQVGWLADRFSKGNVVILAKGLEVAAMMAGAAGICLENVWLMLLMLAIMGTQSAIFGPALNGSIPELFPAEYVNTANAILRVAVTTAILLGIVLAGFVLDVHGPSLGGIRFGNALVAGGVILTAALGLLVSLGVHRQPAAAPRARFPWSGPVESFREFRRVWRDPLLFDTIGLNTFCWFCGSLMALLLNQTGLVQLGLSRSGTSALVMGEILGFAAGGFIGSRLARGPRWYRILAPAAAVMGALMAAVAGCGLLPGGGFQKGCLFSCILGIGLAGGALLIPTEGFIQVRPPPERKGAVIAAANMAAFSGILLSGPAANALNASIQPTLSFGLLGLAAILIAVFHRWRVSRLPC